MLTGEAIMLVLVVCDDFDNRDNNHDGPVTKASWNGEHFQRWSCTMWSLTLGSKPLHLQRSSQSPWSKPENHIIFSGYFGQ